MISSALTCEFVMEYRDGLELVLHDAYFDEAGYVWGAEVSNPEWGIANKTGTQLPLLYTKTEISCPKHTNFLSKLDWEHSFADVLAEHKDKVRVVHSSVLKAVLLQVPQNELVWRTVWCSDERFPTYPSMLSNTWKEYKDMTGVRLDVTLPDQEVYMYRAGQRIKDQWGVGPIHNALWVCSKLHYRDWE